MKYLIVLLVVVVVSTSINGQCFMQMPTPDLALPAGGCIYKGVFFPADGTISQDCMDCTCHKDGSVGCCSSGSTVVQVPKECKIIPADCGTRAVRIDDESIECVEGVAIIARRNM